MNKEFLISKAEERKRSIASGNTYFHYPRDCQDEIVDVALAIIKTISEMRHIKVSIIKYGLQMASDIIDEASQNDTITESEKVSHEKDVNEEIRRIKYQRYKEKVSRQTAKNDMHLRNGEE